MHAHPAGDRGRRARRTRPRASTSASNIGRAAGAGVPGHVHVHVLPRWNGDTNFMTAVAETRVLPESLRHSYDKLRAAWPIPRPPALVPAVERDSHARRSVASAT